MTAIPPFCLSGLPKTTHVRSAAREVAGRAGPNFRTSSHLDSAACMLARTAAGRAGPTGLRQAQSSISKRLDKVLFGKEYIIFDVIATRFAFATTLGHASRNL